MVDFEVELLPKKPFWVIFEDKLEDEEGLLHDGADEVTFPFACFLFDFSVSAYLVIPRLRGSLSSSVTI